MQQQQEKQKVRWNIAETSPYLLLCILFGDAQHYHMVYAISFSKGLGTTTAALDYVSKANKEGKRKKAFYIKCTIEMKRSSFLEAILKEMGWSGSLKIEGVPAMLAFITSNIPLVDQCVFIFDDTHLLSNRVLGILTLLQKATDTKCGFVILGTELLKQRITDGVRHKRPYFEDFYRAMGRRFITLTSLGPRDVEIVCRANGVTDEDKIDIISRIHHSKSLTGIEERFQSYLTENTAIS